MTDRETDRGFLFFGAGAAAVAVAAIITAFFAWPKYRVWSAGKAGEAELAQAVSAKQVAVETAKAKAESAKYEAEAERVRAEGAAEANRIIGDSLKGNEAYLRYLWVIGLRDDSGERIYIPTEAGMPILEARDRDRGNNNNGGGGKDGRK